MYISILRGHVAEENWGLLKKSYAQAIRSTPEGLVQTFLIQGREEPHTWQIISVWTSEEIYDKAHANKLTETCTQMFCEAGSVPERLTFHVEGKYQRI